MAVPTIIATKLAELEQLCEKYPTKIPIEESVPGTWFVSVRTGLAQEKCAQPGILHSDADVLPVGDASRRVQRGG